MNTTTNTTTPDAEKATIQGKVYLVYTRNEWESEHIREIYNSEDLAKDYVAKVKAHWENEPVSDGPEYKAWEKSAPHGMFVKHDEVSYMTRDLLG